MFGQHQDPALDRRLHGSALALLLHLLIGGLVIGMSLIDYLFERKFESIDLPLFISGMGILSLSFLGAGVVRFVQVEYRRSPDHPTDRFVRYFHLIQIFLMILLGVIFLSGLLSVVKLNSDPWSAVVSSFLGCLYMLQIGVHLRGVQHQVEVFPDFLPRGFREVLQWRYLKPYMWILVSVGVCFVAGMAIIVAQFAAL